jgi:hypothetical protein
MNRITSRTTAALVAGLVMATAVGATAGPAQARAAGAPGNSGGHGPGRGPGHAPGTPPGHGNSNGNGNGAANGACAGVPANQACFGTLDPVLDLVVKTLGGFAINQGAGFLMKRTGLAGWLNPDPTQEKLDALQGQIAQVSTQLVTVQASVDQISRDLQQVQLNQAYNAIATPIFHTRYVFDYAYRPLFDAAVAAQNATPSTQAAKVAVLNDKKAEFLAAFDSYQLGPASMQIHDALTVNGVSTSLLDAYGRVIMANTRFVNATHSDTLARLQTVFAEYEALAVWMKAEATAARNPDLLAKLVDTEVIGWPDEERNSMPPRIPADTVIDLGPNAATISSTAGRPMWVPQRQPAPGVSIPSFSWRVADATVPNGVDQALARLNAANTAGFSDWRAPTRAEMAALFSGFVRGKAPRLDTFNPAWSFYNQLQDFVWTSDLVNQSVECGRKTTAGEYPVTDVFTRTYATHSGLWLNNSQPTNYNELVWAPFPKLDARAPGWSSNILPADAYKNCDTYAQNALGGGRGALLATRSTGTVEYFALHRPPGAPSGGEPGGSHGGSQGPRGHGPGGVHGPGGPTRPGRR